MIILYLCVFVLRCNQFPEIFSFRSHDILGALTEVYRSKNDADRLLDGHYCLIGDNLLKMLAIFIRLRVGIPVVLMGECGYERKREKEGKKEREKERKG